MDVADQVVRWSTALAATGVAAVVASARWASSAADSAGSAGHPWTWRACQPAAIHIANANMDCQCRADSTLTAIRVRADW